MKTDLQRFEEKYIPIPESGCWLWTASYTNDRNRYGEFWYKGRKQVAHRAAYDMFVGPIPDGLCVCHKCDVPNCVNPNHLFLGTHQDNIADMMRKGRSNSGGGRAKLTEEQVRAIRLDNRIHKEIAKDYPVDKSSIGHVKTRRTWKNIS